MVESDRYAACIAHLQLESIDCNSRWHGEALAAFAGALGAAGITLCRLQTKCKNGRKMDRTCIERKRFFLFPYVLFW